MIAAWQVRPPRLVTIALARFMIGSQSGSVMSATSTSPSWKSRIWSADLRIRTAPAPAFCPIARPSTRTSAALPPFTLYRCRLAPLRRDCTVSGRACRMYSFPSIAVLAPLDVHRPAVVLLDRDRQPGQLLDLLVGQREPHPLRRVHIDELRRLAHVRVVGEHHLGGLATHAPLQHRRGPGRQTRLPHVPLVRVHRPLHHGLTQPVRRRHEHRVGEPRLGVHREHHAGRPDVRTHHPLHPGRQRHVGVLEPVVHPVGDRPVVVERREHLADRRQHRLDPADVEERLLLPRERRVRQVLGRRRRPHREARLVIALRELRVRVADLLLQRGLQRLLDDRRPHLLAHPRQRVHVVGVQALHQPGDPRRQPLLRHEVPERRRRRREPVRHPHPRRRQVPDHLPQRRVLPPDVLQVRHPQRREPLHVRAHELAPLCVVEAPRPPWPLDDCRVWTIRVDISSTDFVVELMTGSRLAAYMRLGPAQLVRALLERGVLRVRAPLLTHLGEPPRRRDQPDDPVPQVAGSAAGRSVDSRSSSTSG